MAVIGGNGASRAEMKKEIIKEIHQEERQRKLISCIGCLTLKLLILAIPIVLVTVAVAKSGFYEVPLLSDWLYQPSSPERIVKPLVGYDSGQVLRVAMARAEFESAVGLLKVNLTEAELTTLVSAAAAANVDGPMKINQAQMTCSKEGIELFAITPRPKRDVTIKVLFSPSITDEGKLNLEVKSMRIGGLNVPGVMLSLLSKALASQMTKALASAAAGAGELKGIRAGEKKLYLDFMPELKLPF